MASKIAEQKISVALAVAALANNTERYAAERSSEELTKMPASTSTTTSTCKSGQKAQANPTFTAGSLALSPDGHILASADSIQDKTINIWDLRTGQLLRIMKGHSKSVVAVAFSADGQTLASGSEDTTINVWDLHTGQLLRTIKACCDAVSTTTFSADGQMLACGSCS